MTWVLVAPPLVLVLIAAVACAWLALGNSARRRRQEEISAALQPRREMGPRPDGRSVRPRAGSSRPMSASHSQTERRSW